MSTAVGLCQRKRIVVGTVVIVGRRVTEVKVIGWLVPGRTVVKGLSPTEE
jgi:uncharacterized protein (DUF433 family)